MLVIIIIIIAFLWSSSSVSFLLYLSICLFNPQLLTEHLLCTDTAMSIAWGCFYMKKGLREKIHMCWVGIPIPSCWECWGLTRHSRTVLVRAAPLGCRYAIHPPELLVRSGWVWTALETIYLFLLCFPAFFCFPHSMTGVFRERSLNDPSEALLLQNPAQDKIFPCIILVKMLIT